jgi:hypothetical protein
MKKQDYLQKKVFSGRHKSLNQAMSNGLVTRSCLCIFFKKAPEFSRMGNKII